MFNKRYVLILGVVMFYLYSVLFLSSIVFNVNDTMYFQDSVKYSYKFLVCFAFINSLVLLSSKVREAISMCISALLSKATLTTMAVLGYGTFINSILHFILVNRY